MADDIILQLMAKAVPRIAAAGKVVNGHRSGRGGKKRMDGTSNMT